jgi:alcohol dehydrogenase class IV
VAEPEVFSKLAEKAVEKAPHDLIGSLQIALYVGGAAVTAAFGAVWGMVHRLGKRLDKAHGTHVTLLERQIALLLERVEALETKLSETSDEMVDQQKERVTEARQNVERLTSAIVASTEATGRNERSNHSLIEMVRAIHQDLRGLQELYVRSIR